MLVIPLLLVRNEFCRFSNSQVTKVTDKKTENSRVDIVLRNKVALRTHVVFIGPQFQMCHGVQYILCVLCPVVVPVSNFSTFGMGTSSDALVNLIHLLVSHHEKHVA